MPEQPDQAPGGSPAPALAADQRIDQRSSLLLRTAKLVCQSGEYPCLVRDVSAGGVKLRLFHEMPAETNVFLELGNGEVYPLIRVWERDGHAGFRFASPIDVSEFIAEPSPHPRRAIRLRIARPGLLHTGSLALPVMLRDLSQHGAGIETPNPLSVHQPVTLALPGLPDKRGRVCWRKRTAFGLVFEQTLRLDELARQALVLQPVTPGAAPAAAPRARTM